MPRIPEMDEPATPSSAWAATSQGQRTWAPPRRDLDVDVLVIGAGFTGLSAALHLRERGRSVAVVDAAEPGWGASGRNGGQVIPGLKDDPDTLEAIHGPDLGRRVVATAGATAETLFSLVRRYNIHCHARQDGWVQPAHSDEALATIRDRADQWERRGVAAELLDAGEVTERLGCAPGLYRGGWLDPRGGCVQPLALARGMASAVAEHGGAVHGGTRVSALRRSGDRWIATAGPATATASRVILATNGYTDDLWPGLGQSLVTVFSQQVATQPLPEHIRQTVLPQGQVASDTRRLMRYYRLDPEGRLLMGGRGVFEDAPALASATPLREELRRVFPQTADVPLETTWAGRVAMTMDHLPHLHVLDDGVFAGLGFNGRGVGMGVTMGRLLADLADGAAPEAMDFPVSRPRRVPLHGLRRPVAAALIGWYRWLDRRDERRTPGA